MGDFNFNCLLMDYGEVGVSDTDAFRISVKGRTVPLLLDPSYFPLKIDGDKINLSIEYAENSEKMLVERIRNEQLLHTKVLDHAEMDVYNMTDYQKHMTFLYLVGCVRDGR